MSLGEVVKSRRKQMHLTQDQVAKLVDISKPYLSNIETGKAKNPPTDGKVRSLERVLKFSDGELLRLAHLARTPADVRQEHELLKAEVQRLQGMLKDLFENSPVAVKESGVDLGTILERVKEQGNIRQLSAGVAVPVINKVAAGYPHHFTDLDYPPSVAEEYIRCPDMHDSQAFAARIVGDSMEPVYHEGDIVIFSPNCEPLNGNDCFVRFAGDGGTTFKRFYQDNQDAIRLQPLNNKYPAQTHPVHAVTGLWPAVFRIERLR
jgi:SOS-response transcriptional repressor LexA